MDFFKTFTKLVGLILITSILSCGTYRNNNNSNLPEIKNATYKSYSFNNDKGYNVKFEYKSQQIIPKEIILFGIRQSIPPNAIIGNKVNLNIIHQTSTIQNHIIKGTDLPNGVIFEIDGTKYLKQVKFKTN